MLYALVFGGVLRLGKHYPMDAAVLFSVTALLSSVLYVGSLMLHLQFRGDFGVMPDEALALGPALKKNAKKNNSGGIAHFISVSLGDLALLLGPVGRSNSYGARLFNLQAREAKDV